MPFYTGITPVHRLGDYWVKREDLAHWTDLNFPSGSKVRQYMSMAQGTSNTPPCLVGCSANSAMAIYVASTAKQLRTKGIIYTAARKKQTDGIKYALEMGAEVVEVKPGYLSLIRSRVRARAIELGEVVKWSPQLAIEDTIRQCENIPEGVKRIIVPTGSGLTAAGILMGLAPKKHHPIVVAIATSSMTSKEQIYARAAKSGNWLELPPFEFIPPTSSYNHYEIAKLPDGTPLDPFYSAKALKYLQKDDILWPVGLRPVRSMPKDCKTAFKDWEGPRAKILADIAEFDGQFLE